MKCESAVVLCIPRPWLLGSDCSEDRVPNTPHADLSASFSWVPVSGKQMCWWDHNLTTYVTSCVHVISSVCCIDLFCCYVVKCMYTYSRCVWCYLENQDNFCHWSVCILHIRTARSKMEYVVACNSYGVNQSVCFRIFEADFSECLCLGEHPKTKHLTASHSISQLQSWGLSCA